MCPIESALSLQIVVAFTLHSNWNFCSLNLSLFTRLNLNVFFLFKLWTRPLLASDDMWLLGQLKQIISKTKLDSSGDINETRPRQSTKWLCLF